MPKQIQEKLCACTCNLRFVHLGVYESWCGSLALVGSSAWLAACLRNLPREQDGHGQQQRGEVKFWLV